MNKASRQQVLKEAWVGDAVLSLYVRLKILREDGAIDASKADRMSSNRFLAAIAEASETEARIGRRYLSGGLEEAFAWIDANLLPLFEKQEAKRLRGRS